MKLVINRIKEGNFETLGNGYILNNGKVLFTFVTLELPNKHNKINISSIPADKYKGVVIVRPNGKKAILIKDVPNRTSILIHIGNFFTDIKGCVLVGEYFDLINKDSLADICNSSLTMGGLLAVLPPLGVEFDIEINKLKS